MHFKDWVYKLRKKKAGHEGFREIVNSLEEGLEKVVELRKLDG